MAHFLTSSSLTSPELTCVWLSEVFIFLSGSLSAFITSSPLLEGGKVSNTGTGSWLHSSGGSAERSSLLQVEWWLLRCFQDALSDTSLGGCFRQVRGCGKAETAAYVSRISS